MTKRIRLRLLTAFTILTFSSTFGCTTYRRIPVESITPDEATTLVDKRVKLYTKGGMYSLTVNRVEYPYVHGTKIKRSRDSDDSTTDGTAEIRVDLREVTKIELYDPTREGARFVWTFLGVAALLVIVFSVADFDRDE